MNDKMDLRIQKTYLGLHNAFTELLEEKRFEDFTVNELCDRAMIRRATFYKHFADKYEYYTFYLKEVCATFQDQLPPDVTADEVNSYFLHMCCELLRFVKEHERMIKNCLGSNMLPILLHILLEQIRNDLFSVLLRTKDSNKMNNIQMEGISSFYAGGVLSMLFRFLECDNNITEDNFTEIVSSLLGNRFTNQVL